MVAGADDIRAEVEMLWAFHTRRLRAATPPARLADRVAFSQPPPLHVVRCTRCGLVYRNPRERAGELTALYAREDLAPEVLTALFRTQRTAARAQARRLTRVAGRTGSGLEVGSYVGGFLAAAAELGWRFEGVDVNEQTNALARERGFTIATGEISKVSRAARVDAIAFWNCFDQLADPRAALREARERLSPGGLVVVRVPNGAFYATVRRALRGPAAPLARSLLAHNNLLGFPYRHGLTVGSLEWLFEREGLSLVHLHGDSLVPTADAWTRPWAALEERLLRSALAPLALGGRAGAAVAPWMEAYAQLAPRDHRTAPGRAGV